MPVAGNLNGRRISPPQGGVEMTGVICHVEPAKALSFRTKRGILVPVKISPPPTAGGLCHPCSIRRAIAHRSIMMVMISAEK
ncbi:MAG: hypothetical protein CVV24_11285 [Ignavibacteriae bacterium HGW-Ignavibacteriae-3]|nr:MAG: hypothetical protein CVV24_11285 [Ignavibacteriae bacterium HGW-Ignavibacteriae-3]